MMTSFSTNFRAVDVRANTPVASERRVDKAEKKDGAVGDHGQTRMVRAFGLVKAGNRD